MIESWLRESALAWRALLRAPAFTALVVLTLALGIGGTTTMFTAVNAAFLKPLPYPQADRLAMIWQTREDNPQVRASTLDAVDWAAQNRSFSAMSIFRSGSANVTSGPAPERVTAGYVIPGFFTTMGVAPRLGRTFAEDESVSGGHRLVVIGHHLWRQAFNGDPRVLGKPLGIEGVDFQVIGVMPEGFAFPDDAGLWLAVSTDDGSDRASHNNRVVARLKPGVTFEQAQADMEAVTAALAESYPDSNTGFGVNVVPLRRDLLGKAGPVLLLLLGAVSFVLLIACVNVVNLLLARSLARHNEATLRLALGASRWALLRPFLFESLWLGLLGGAGGLALAFAGSRVLAVLAPAGALDPEKFRIDGAVLLFTLLVSLLVGLLCGFAPAWGASRQDLRAALAAGAPSLLGSAGRRGMNVLVAAEVALAFVLLVGAGLQIQSVRRLEAAELGFGTENVSILKFSMGDGFTRSRYDDSAWRVRFLDQLLDGVSRMGGVRAAGAVSQAPLAGGSYNAPLELENLSGEPGSSEAHYRLVGGDYFAALGIPVLRGRAFTRDDRAESPKVAIVNQLMARNLAGAGPVLGRRVRIPNMDGIEDWAEVVGVIGDVRHFGAGSDPVPEVYFPYPQRPDRTWMMAVAVRSEPEPAALAPRIREQVRALDPGLPYRSETLEGLLRDNLAQARFRAFLLIGFAATALALAAVGIFGVVSYAVGRRSREVGIRMALGADRGAVRGLLLRGGMTPVAFGLAAGVAAALALLRLLASLVSDVGGTDTATFATVAALLGAIALAATYVPARRATRVDPVEALRTE